MKVVLTIVVVLAVAAASWLIVRSRAQESVREPSAAGGPNPKEVYVGIRNMALQASRTKLNLAATAKPTQPWGVLMDWALPNGTATIVAISDGSASVYLSSGGGYIGGIGQDPIRNAASHAVEVASSVQLPADSVTTYPLPGQHGVFFYFLTDSGVFTLRSNDQELRLPAHPLSKLGDAMQGVVTQYRLWEEQKKSGAK